MKFKDYYDADCAKLLFRKIKPAAQYFSEKAFISFVDENISDKELSGRMDVFVDAFELCLPDDTEIVEKKKSVNKHILFRDLDENQKFDTSVNERKFFPDTVKMVAYRAETALCNIIKNDMTSPERARTLMRKFYFSDADIEEDKANRLLIVKIHRTNHRHEDAVLEKLCEVLNQTQTVFPSSGLTLFFVVGTK